MTLKVNTINSEMTTQDYNEILKKFNLYKYDARFHYMLLSRMQGDCEYYLGCGGRRAKDLWAGNEHDHITIMIALWHTVPTPPEWLTLEEICEFATKMNVAL